MQNVLFYFGFKKVDMNKYEKILEQALKQERCRNMKLIYRNNKINFSKPHFLDCSFKSCTQLRLNSKVKFFYDWQTKVYANMFFQRLLIAPYTKTCALKFLSCCSNDKNNNYVKMFSSNFI